MLQLDHLPGSPVHRRFVASPRPGSPDRLEPVLALLGAGAVVEAVGAPRVAALLVVVVVLPVEAEALLALAEEQL